MAIRHDQDGDGGAGGGAIFLIIVAAAAAVTNVVRNVVGAFKDFLDIRDRSKKP